MRCIIYKSNKPIGFIFSKYFYGYVLTISNIKISLVKINRCEMLHEAVIRSLNIKTSLKDRIEHNIALRIF